MNTSSKPVITRYVLSWMPSVSMEHHFCIEALEEAFQKGNPDIFNTDQGSQFTSEAFVSALTAKGGRISMDGRGRAMDNIMIERLWRSIKYEEMYLKDYESVADARSGLRVYNSSSDSKETRYRRLPLGRMKILSSRKGM